MTARKLQDEKHITNALVHLDGKLLNIVSLVLEQEFGQHHQFKIVLDYDAMKNSFLDNPADQINLIGKLLDIDLQQGDDSANAYEFRGVIENVHLDGSEGRHGYLVLEGSSTTVLLERGKRLDIFANMSLRRVFEEVTSGVKDDRLSAYNNPAYRVPVPFLMQYYESDWEFLQRLSALSGEALLYTGIDLVFGQYPDWPVTEIMYNRELSEIQFGSRLLANTFTHYQYLCDRDETLQQSSSNSLENSNEFLDTAAGRGAELVPERPVLLPAPLEVGDKGALGDLVERRKTSTAAETVYIKGTTKTCAPRIGRLLNISMPADISETSGLGTYRVIKVTHTIDQNNHYSCQFEAIPADLKFFPTPEVSMPVANSIRAMVIANDDPDGFGRVKVEFPFARDRVSDVWLRVMSPDAGGLVGYGNRKSGIVEKNRGMVFIPEAGDQVMIGFEFGDPNRPYVMGSLFHGMNTEGGGSENHRKSIITRSGHTLEFDDSEEGLGITIKDENGNVIHLDSKGKNIEITAPETITLNAKNIHVNAEESISTYSGMNTDIQVGNNLNQTVDNEFSLTANKSNTTIDTDCTLNAKKVEQTADKIIIDSTKDDLDLSSSKKVNVQSSDKVNLF